MKVKVIQKFRDKETKKVHLIDEIFECSDKRFKEIKSAGDYVEVVTPDPEEKKVK